MVLQLRRAPLIPVQPVAFPEPVRVAPLVDEDRRAVVAKRKPSLHLRFSRQQPE
jgi:hypothetical protein